MTIQIECSGLSPLLMHSDGTSDLLARGSAAARPGGLIHLDVERRRPL